MKKKSFFLSLTLAVLVGLYSCTKDKAQTAAPVDCSSVNARNNIYAPDSANANISNTINLYCNYSPCHDAGTASGGVNLSDYTDVVYAFNHNNVICALKGAGCTQMPNTGTPLPDSLILQIQCWQQNGFPQ